MLFNIYYVNTFKMYEIKMMINNKMKINEQTQKEKSTEDEVLAEAEISMPKLFKLRAKGGNVTNDTKKFVENFDIKSTKSTMLKEVIEKGNKFNLIEKEKLKEGMLVKIDSIVVELTNTEEIMGVKALNNNAINMVYEGLDIGKVFDSVLKDYAYIFEAKTENQDNLVFKIPVTFENEFESMYSVNDILIGRVSLVGIYKGIVDREEIRNTIDILSNNAQKEKQKPLDVEIVDSDDEVEHEKTVNNSEYHYIDVIAIIQEIHIDEGANRK